MKLTNAMTLPIFYAPLIDTDPVLPEEESAHCTKVLRLGRGAELNVTDGHGAFYRAVIEEAHPRHCRVTVVEHTVAPPLWTYGLHVAVAPTKNIDRTEWFLEKAAEVGIDSVTLLRCRYSERREVKMERLQRVLVAAMKQSGQARLPLLTGMTDFADFIARPAAADCRLIAHCRASELPTMSTCYHPRGGDVLILIGPEGDFSAEEVTMAESAGYRGVSLGRTRLRTETAALAACHAIHVLNDE